MWLIVFENGFSNVQKFFILKIDSCKGEGGIGVHWHCICFGGHRQHVCPKNGNVVTLSHHFTISPSLDTLDFDAYSAVV